MNAPNENFANCEKHLQIHTRGIINNKEAGQLYTKISDLSEVGCHSCLDLYKCKFSNHILDILAKKDDKIFRKKSITPNNIEFNRI